MGKLILDIQFRLIISHRMLGYDCEMTKEDFDGMIEDCVNVSIRHTQKIVKGIAKKITNEINH